MFIVDIIFLCFSHVDTAVPPYTVHRRTESIDIGAYVKFMFWSPIRIYYIGDNDHE